LVIISLNLDLFSIFNFLANKKPKFLAFSNSSIESSVKTIGEDVDFFHFIYLKFPYLDNLFENSYFSIIVCINSSSGHLDYLNK
ncbi:TPA: hypothetical protein ACHVDE_001892, partial [Streptococcus suis]